jgi:DNA-binding YbaB/EbfC family protein
MNINPFEILKNVQKFQDQIGGIQEKLAALSVTGSSGGGMVEVDLNGKFEVLDVRISAEALADRDTELVGDLAAAAFSDALTKVRIAINREAGSLTGIGGLFGGTPS